jgi:hypothetical protein
MSVCASLLMNFAYDLARSPVPGIAVGTRQPWKEKPQPSPATAPHFPHETLEMKNHELDFE